MTRPYVTSSRIADLTAVLTDQDWRTLRAVARCSVMTGSQVRKLFYEDSDTGKRLARRDLARLTELRVLGRLDRRIGGVRRGSDGYVYALDVAGQRLAHPDLPRYRPPWTPGGQHLAHTVAVTQLYVDLATKVHAQAHLVDFTAEPACWRTYTGPGGGRMTLKPDAWVQIETDEYEDQAFIELDRATEPKTRIAAKARSYVQYWRTGIEQARHGVFPLVVWLGPDLHRVAQLTEALEELPPETRHLFAVATHQAAAHQLLTGSLMAPTT